MCPAPWNSDPLPAHLMQQQQHPDLSAGYPVSKATRATPLTHSPVDAPICLECQALELTFFDPTCVSCKKQLMSASSEIAHVFSALRQWVPQVQQNIEFLVDEALRRGAHPDDRDCLTDMTLLMYACKAGANGVGDLEAAARVAQKLIDLGADLNLRCKWTDMTALHYAAYFDVAPVLIQLLKKSKGVDVDSTCSEYERGTALHIAAANLSAEAARVLLNYGADKSLLDDLARSPVDCIPDSEDFGVIPDAQELVERMQALLTATNIGDAAEQKPLRKLSGEVSGRTALKSLGLKVGDRVLVNATKIGTLRYCGTTDFAPGLWAGVALDEPEGKNDGAVKGVLYFKCPPGHGVFVQANKVAKVGREYREEVKVQPRLNVVNRGKVDTSHVSSRLTDRLAFIEEKAEIRVGDRVKVAMAAEQQQLGTVRFVGQVDFVQDDDSRWFGVELEKPFGRHDGTVQGVRYFAAADNCGIFVTEAKLTKIVNVQQMQAALAAATTNGEGEKGPTRRRSLSMKHRLAQSNSSLLSPDADAPVSSPVTSSTGDTGIGTKGENRVVRNNAEQFKEEGWQTVSATQFNKFKKNVPKKYLEAGTGVICIHNKEMGVVKYVGRVDFASGIWVGLELREPKGRHDGTVEGKRYYTCKPNHGLMLRPSKISVHGINGDNLIKPESEYPF